MKKQIADLTAKLVAEYFEANPQTERSKKDVQTEMREKAVAQLQKQAEAVANAENTENEDGEKAGTENGQTPIEETESGKMPEDGQIEATEIIKAATDALAACDTMQDWNDWSEKYGSVFQLRRKHDNALVLSAKEIPSQKPQHEGKLLGFILDGTKKRPNCAVPYLFRYYEVVTR